MVACSDATVMLRALLLPYRLWYVIFVLEHFALLFPVCMIFFKIYFLWCGWKVFLVAFTHHSGTLDNIAFD